MYHAKGTLGNVKQQIWNRQTDVTNEFKQNRWAILWWAARFEARLRGVIIAEDIVGGDTPSQYTLRNFEFANWLTNWIFRPC